MNLDSYVDGLWTLENRFIKTLTPTQAQVNQIRLIGSVSEATVLGWFNPAPSYSGLIPRAAYESSLRENVYERRRRTWQLRTTLGILMYDGIQQGPNLTGKAETTIIQANDLRGAVVQARALCAGDIDPFLAVAFYDCQMQPLGATRYQLVVKYNQIAPSEYQKFRDIYYPRFKAASQENDESEPEVDE